MEELCARPLSPAVEVEDLTHGGTHAAACWVTNNMRSHPGDWPLKSYLSARKIKHCTGKAQAYPYAGAFAGVTLYEPRVKPTEMGEPTGMAYRYEG